MDQLLSDWPGGTAAIVAQGFLIVVGAALGIKLVDDLKALAVKVRARRVRTSRPRP